MKTIAFLNSSIANLTTIGVTLSSIRATGITHVLNYSYCKNITDTAQLTNWLNACTAAGLKTIIDLSGLTSIASNWNGSNTWPANSVTVEDIVEVADAHAACDGWFTSDEATGTDYSISNRAVVYTFIKNLSDLSVYEAVVGYDALAYSGNVHDFVISGIYPWYPTARTFQAGMIALRDEVRYQYRYLTNNDRANLIFVFQSFGVDATHMPPVSSFLAIYEYLKGTWFTGGIAFYNWTEGARTDWQLPWNNYPIRASITALCGAYLSGDSTVRTTTVCSGKTRFNITKTGGTNTTLLENDAGALYFLPSAPSLLTAIGSSHVVFSTGATYAQIIALHNGTTIFIGTKLYLLIYGTAQTGNDITKACRFVGYEVIEEVTFDGDSTTFDGDSTKW